MHRPIIVWIYLSLFLIPTACATSPPVAAAPSKDIRESLGTIGVASDRFTPKLRFQGPEPAKGAGGAAGKTASRGLVKLWKGCGQAMLEGAPTIILPVLVFVGCVYVMPFVAIGAAAYGGASDAAKADRFAKKARKHEVKALRPVIDPALAAMAAERPLHARLLEQVPVRTRGTVVGVTQTGRVRYKDLRSQDIDTMLEVRVARLDVSSENAFVLTAQGRLIRVTDSEELYANTYTFDIAPRPLSEWTADGVDTLRAALVRGYQGLADKIVDDLFPAPPVRDPIHT